MLYVVTTGLGSYCTMYRYVEQYTRSLVVTMRTFYIVNTHRYTIHSHAYIHNHTHTHTHTQVHTLNWRQNCEYVVHALSKKTRAASIVYYT